jgi:hypothetical protein
MSPFFLNATSQTVAATDVTTSTHAKFRLNIEFKEITDPGNANIPDHESLYIFQMGGSLKEF